MTAPVRRGAVPAHLRKYDAESQLARLTGGKDQLTVSQSRLFQTPYRNFRLEHVAHQDHVLLHIHPADRLGYVQPERFCPELEQRFDSTSWPPRVNFVEDGVRGPTYSVLYSGRIPRSFCEYLRTVLTRLDKMLDAL